MAEKRTPLDLVADVWRVLRNPSTWKVIGIAVTIATTVATSIIKYSFHWAVNERNALEIGLRECKQRIENEERTREGITDKLLMQQNIDYEQLRLMGAQVVQFVAIERDQDVRKAVDLYRELLGSWPTCSSSSNCMPPSKAVENSLKIYLPKSYRNRNR